LLAKLEQKHNKELARSLGHSFFFFHVNRKQSKAQKGQN
jgi:hypothetical protein